METLVLNEKIEMLPLYKQQEVVDFVDFLLSSLSIKEANGNLQTNKHPFAGCMSGTFGEMSDDFNEPLDDFKDYM
jgi:hypothetical protein